MAILGVPLGPGSQVIGVLFAATAASAVRPLRGGAAGLAGGARGDRHGQRPAAGGDARRAGRAARRPAVSCAPTPTSVERAAGAHDRFIDVVLRGGGVEDVAAAVTEALGGTITVLDEEGRPTPRPDPDVAARSPPDPAAALTRPARPAARCATAAGGPRRSPSTTSCSAAWSCAGTPALRRRPAHPRAGRPGDRAAAADPPHRRPRPRTGCAASCWRSCSAGRSATRRAARAGPPPAGPTWTSRWRRGGPRRRSGPSAGRWPPPPTWRRRAAGWPPLHDGCVVLCLPDLAPGVAGTPCAGSWPRRAAPVTVGAAGSGPRAGRGEAAHAEAARAPRPSWRSGGPGTRRRPRAGLLRPARRRGPGRRGSSTPPSAPVLDYDARRGTTWWPRSRPTSRRAPPPPGRPRRCRCTSTPSPSASSGSAG